MKYLLDTNIFLWWLDGDSRLSKEYSEIINNPNHIKLISVVSVWEIIIKVRLGKFPLSIPVEKILEKSEFDLLSVELKHVLELGKLPGIHKDPFDRILVAQAKVEECTLLSSDKLLKKYNVSRRQLPRIKINDPAIIKFEPKKGDIIEIIRPSPTIGKSYFYRVVV